MYLHTKQKRSKYKNHIILRPMQSILSLSIAQNWKNNAPILFENKLAENCKVYKIRTHFQIVIG